MPRDEGGARSMVVEGARLGGRTTLHGIGSRDRGVFKNSTVGVFKNSTVTYCGQIRDGFACGLGVLDFGDTKIYAEYGPDGKCHGRYLDRGYGGYYVFDHGEVKERGWTYSNDACCEYDGAFCAADNPRLLALIAHVVPVEALARAAANEAKQAVQALPRRLAGLELMVTVMLARYREPTVSSALAGGLMTLPSGTLSLVCDAILR
jgi:hypothetical protein